MEDPLFDPWGAEAEGSSPRKSNPGRWRAPTDPPAPPSADDERPPRTSSAHETAARPRSAPRARLTGTPGFLRTMAMPRLEALAQRLLLARHVAVVEDFLDRSPPTLRISVRTWRGPLDEGAHIPNEGALEIEIAAEPDERVVLRVWLDGSSEPTELARVPPSKVGGSWIDDVALQFVRQVLTRG